METIVSERGKIALPKAIRVDLGLKARTVLEIKLEDGKIIGWKREESDPVQRWRGRGRLPRGSISVDAYLKASRE